MIKISIFLLLILAAAMNFSAQTEQIKFDDEARLTLFSNDAIKSPALSDTGKFVRKEAIAVFTGFGKSPSQFTFGQFAAESDLNKLKKLPKKQRNSLFNKIYKINTAYSFKQGETELYINGFDSIDFRHLYECQKCEVKIVFVIVEFKAGEKFYYSPFIESIERIKNID